MILLIDNYDSFTYNLYQQLAMLGQDVVIVRNDAITISDIEELHPEAIVLSPGPGNPNDAGICMEVIQAFYMKYPILGICLGHQSIGAAFGANIVQARTIMHGKTSTIAHTQNELFSVFNSPITVMRYHSLVIEEKSLIDCFEILARAEDDQEIMAIKHRDYPLYGLQFHPESIGTEQGSQLIKGFIDTLH